MNNKTKNSIRRRLNRPHNPLKEASVGFYPGTKSQRRYWVRMGWIKMDNGWIRGRYYLTEKGLKSLRED